MENLQTQIASLEALITKANALPFEKKIQDVKTATPTKSVQTVSPDSGYDGIASVTVAAIPSKYQDVTTPLVELNAANGGTAATTMAAAVDNTEAHASNQEALIAQIASALEGKAAGGASVETCTITRNSELSIVAYVDINGVAQVLDNETNTALSATCIKNTLVSCYDLNGINGVTTTGGEILFENIYYNFCLIRATGDITVSN